MVCVLKLLIRPHVRSPDLRTRGRISHQTGISCFPKPYPDLCRRPAGVGGLHPSAARAAFCRYVSGLGGGATHSGADESTVAEFIEMSDGAKVR